jgi:hypothetical protein
VLFSGGSVGDMVAAWGMSNVSVTGGSMGTLNIQNEALMTLSGGIFTQNIDTHNIITIVGRDFAVDGQPFGYGILDTGGTDYFDGILSGTLSNGDPVNNMFQIRRDGQIILTPVPSAVVLGSLGLTFSGWLLRRRKMF